MTRPSPREGRHDGRQVQGDRARPVYTAPPVFLQLEQDYKRQRQRINKAKAKGKRIDDDDDDDDDELDQLASDYDESGYASATSNKKTRKQQKVAAKSRKRKDVAVEGSSPFDKLSIELVLHICSFVPHEQLFYLASLSKRFHETLNSKHLRKTINDMWKAAREAVEPELPVMSDMREKEFAHLLYSKQCSFCQKEEGEGDPFVRVVMCKSCRRERLIDVKKVRAEFPQVMRRAPECCIATHIGFLGHETKSCFVFRTDLFYESEELLKRERKDLDTFEREQCRSFENRGKGSNRKSLYVPDFEKKLPKEGTGKRVVDYVEKREAVLQEYHNEGWALWDWIVERKIAAKYKGTEGAYARRQAIENRVLELDGFSEEDFDDHWRKSAVITNGPSEIDGKAWKKLKPKVVKVIESGRKLREAAVAQARFDKRLEHLRTSVYIPLLESRQGETWEFPLFADFCLLPSVLTLFDPSETERDRISKRKWNELEDDIIEESNSWIDSIQLAAIKLVLSRTLDLEPGEALSEDPRAYEAYVEDEDWLDLVKSFVCCDISPCRNARYTGDRQVFFGSMFEVLAHQHKDHADLAPNFDDESIRPRFSLPVPVASAVSELLNLLGLDASSAGSKSLNRAFSRRTRLQWHNAPRVAHGTSRKETDWRKLISKIKLESDRYEKDDRGLEPLIAIFDLVKGKWRKRKSSVAPQASVVEREDEEESESRDNDDETEGDEDNDDEE